MSCSRTITQSLLHTMVHPLFSRGASENAPYLAVSLCIRTYETLCVGSRSKTKRQSMEQVVVPCGTAKDGPFSKLRQTAMDGSFYEAQRINTGCTIL